MILANGSALAYQKAAEKYFGKFSEHILKDINK
jgi:hypothetical protein